MGLPIRLLSLSFMTALIAGCAAGAANPPLRPVHPTERTAQSAPILGASQKTKIRLVAPLQATLTRTGVVLELTASRCEHKPVPKKVDRDGFPLDAAVFTPPHSATISFTVATFANPCDRHHSEGIHSESIIFPSPVPSATPVFTTDGYYAIALQAGETGHVSVLDVSGPVTTGDDGTMHFTQTWLPLSANDSYAFYLATLKSHGDNDGD